MYICKTANTTPCYITDLSFRDLGIRGDPGTNVLWILRDDCTWGCICSLSLLALLPSPQASSEMSNGKATPADIPPSIRLRPISAQFCSQARSLKARNCPLVSPGGAITHTWQGGCAKRCPGQHHAPFRRGAWSPVLFPLHFLQGFVNSDWDVMVFSFANDEDHISAIKHPFTTAAF